MLAQILQRQTAMKTNSWIAGLLDRLRGYETAAPAEPANPGRRKTDGAQAQGIAPVDGQSLQAVVAQLRRGFGVVGMFSFFINLLVLTSPLYMLQIFDRVLTGGRWETLLMLTLIAGIAILLMGLLEMVRGQVLGRIGRWLYQRLAPGLLQSGLLGRTRGGAEASQALRDLGVVRNFLTSPSTNVILDAPWVPVFLAIIWIMHPLLGTVALGAAAALFGIAIANDLMSRNLLHEANKLSGKAGTYADGALARTEPIRAMGMSQGVINQWAEAQAPALDYHLQASDRSSNLSGLSRFVRLFVQVLILGTGAYLILQGDLTPGGMIAASIMLGRGLAPLEQAVGGWRAMVNARESYHRLRDTIQSLQAEERQLPLPPPKGHVECTNVGLRLPDADKAVLRGIGFEIQPGKALGIIGPSGAGKSMLCRIVVGVLNPMVGEVRLDGVNIHSRRSDDLGPYVGYLPQDVGLLGGKIANNIARLSANPDPEAVIEAAQAAGVHRMILDLPQGYETDIGQDGSRLSGGQRQRIALARAFYGKPKLLVLDEPNSNLDSEGDAALERAIEAAKGWGAAVILVTHQARLLRTTEQILFLRGGVAEFVGPSEEFMRRMQAIEHRNPDDKAAPQIEGTATTGGST